jgi:hypothetical protein
MSRGRLCGWALGENSALPFGSKTYSSVSSQEACAVAETQVPGLVSELRPQNRYVGGLLLKGTVLFTREAPN